MKKSRHILFAAVIWLAAPALYGNFYVGGSFGFGFPRDHGDSDGNEIRLYDDLGGSAAIGFDFDPLRLEAEFLMRSSDVQSFRDEEGTEGARGSIENMGIMLNGYYIIHTAHLLRPYVGGGFGASRISARNIRSGGETRFDDRDTVFAYQAMAGVDYELSMNANIRVGYRFFGTQKASWDDVRVDGSRIHIVETGLVWRF